MSQGKNFYDAFNTASRQHVNKHPFVFRYCIGDTEFTVDVLDSDKFTTLFSKINVINKALAQGEGVNMETLSQYASRFAAKLGPALQNLKIIEVDEVNRKILLKSTKSLNEHGRISSYEVVMTSQGAIDITRYRCDRNAKRHEVVPFAVTKETLQLFIQHLCDLSCWPTV